MQCIPTEWHSLLNRIPANLLLLDSQGLIPATNERLASYLEYQPRE